MRLKLSELSFLPLALGADGRRDLPSRPLPAAAPITTASMPTVSAIWSIHSRTGYKRIIVGAGASGQGTRDLRAAGERDDVVYLDEEDDGEVVFRDCWKPAGAAQGPQLHVRPRGRRDAGPARRLPLGTARGARSGAAARTALIWSCFCGQ